MSILKVEIGQPVTMTVSDVENAQGKFGPQLKFIAANGDCLFVKADTAQRQLDRIGVTVESAAGKTLLFEKVQKGDKTFLNINPARQSSEAKQGVGVGAGKSAGNGSAGGVAPRPLVPLYEQCLTAAKEVVQRQLGKAATTENVIAATATLYIAATRNDAPLYAPRDDFETKHPALEDTDDELPF